MTANRETVCECGHPAVTICGHDEWIAICGAPTCGEHGTGGVHDDGKLCPAHGEQEAEA